MTAQNPKPSLSMEAELALLRDEVRHLRSSLRTWQRMHQSAVENQDHWRFLCKHLEGQVERLRGQAALRPAPSQFVSPQTARITPVVQLTFPKPSTSNPKAPCLS
jgi:hypothetical protein